jgi:hypothetical protein
MKATNGALLLAEKAFGKGRVMVFTSTCDRDWTNFPIRPVFLPWVFRLVAYLAQEPLGVPVFHHTGSAVHLPLDSLKGGPLVIKKPDGTTGYGTTEEGESPALVFTDTVNPGVYTLLTTDQKEKVGQFAVNLESYESDLTYLDDVLAERGDPEEPRDKRIAEALKAEDMLNRPLVTFVGNPEEAREAIYGARGSTKLWDWLLLGVLAIAFFEPWLANRISARHYGRPAVVPSLPGPEPAAQARGVKS